MDAHFLAEIQRMVQHFANHPSDEETVKLRASEAMQTRVRELLQRNRDGGFTEEEEQEWQCVESLQDMVRSG